MPGLPLAEGGPSKKKKKEGSPSWVCYTLVEDVIVIPLFQHLFVDIREVEFGILSKFLTHYVVAILFIIKYIRRKFQKSVPNGKITKKKEE